MLGGAAPWVLGGIAAACAAVAVALHVGYPGSLLTLVPSADVPGVHVDFATFRASAVALLDGRDLYATDALLTNLNPPLLAVLFTPFAALDAVIGYRFLTGVTALLVLATVVGVARELRLGWTTMAAVVAAVAASSPLHGTLVLGQVYGLLLAVLAAGWVAAARDRPVLGALLWGVAVALKPSLAPVLLLALVLRRWPALWAGVGAAAAATAVGWLVAGPASGLRWLRIAAAEPVPGVADNASLPGVAARFGLPAALGVLLGATVLVVTLVALARARDRVDRAGTAPWALIAAGLLAAPIAWHNYLLVLLPGVLVLLAVGRRAVAVALLAATLVPVAWNGFWTGLPGGSVALSLYAAILLAHWWALLSAATAPVPLPASRPSVTGWRRPRSLSR